MGVEGGGEGRGAAGIVLYLYEWCTSDVAIIGSSNGSTDQCNVQLLPELIMTMSNVSFIQHIYEYENIHHTHTHTHTL